MNRPAIWPEVRPATLAGLLRARAAERPDRVAFTFLADGEEESGRLTYAGLDRQARTIAASLRETLAPGDRALLLFPPGLEFIAAFFGCLYAGVIAVPAYPPRSNDRSQSRLRSIVKDAEPRAALTTSSILAGLEGAGGLLARAAELAPELALLRWLPTDALELYGSDTGEISLGALRDPDRFRPDRERDRASEPDPDSVAFLQYTSGSTAAAKGVMVTHANLLHNERMIGQAFAQDEDTVVVGWLPLYHDMGLIGNVLQPLHAGARCVLMSPVAFLQKPLRWLEAISRYRGTTSGGPNFAYELCLRRISPEERARLDLYSWKVAFNGAEPVREATLERFAEAFAGAGFRKEAFYPCYGLAEATLLVTGGTVGRAPRVEAVDAAALESHEVRPADPDAPEGAGVRRLVGCGHAWLDQRVLVADPETGHECPPDKVGEIWVAGPSVARGYWRNPDATERDFGAFLSNGDGPFLRTGDLGFMTGGELYVTGRIKDLIIIRGRNHYPQDLELTAERSHPDLHPGGGAAFSVDVNGEERLVIVHEVERRRREGGAGVPAAEIGEAVRRAVAEEHEVQVHEVVLIRSGTLPKTSSGKVQRHAARSGYLAGNLLVVGRSALAEAGGPAVPALDLNREALDALPAGERGAMVEAYLRDRAAALIGVPAGQIDPAQPLTGFGLDSLAAVELKGAVEAALGAPVSLADLLQGADLRSLAAQVLAGLEAGRDRDEAEVPRLVPLPAAARAMDQPLSFGQKSLWFLDRLAPEGGAYNIVAAARTRSELDTAALGRALARLTARHEAFRTVFHTVEGLGDEPAQRVLPAEEAPPVDLIVEDASGWSERELHARLEAEAWRPFSLERGPLLRVRVWESPGERTVLLAVHHIVADFWSLAVVARELSALYREETGGPAADLAPLPISYLDFERWQGERLAGPRGERLWDYWRERLGGSSGSLPDLDLPTDRPRPPVQTYRGAARAALFPATLADRLRTLAASRGATLYMALLAAFQAQLGRAARQADLAVGSPTAGRGAPELSGVVGYFVNPVVLRADLAGDPSFAELIDRARATALGALEHADYPFALLAERLRPARDPARSPLFQAMLVLQSGRPQDDPGLAAFALGEEGARIELGGLGLDSVALAERRSAFDLSLRLAETAEGALLASLEINADLFDGTTAARMLEQLRTFLEEAVADPGRPLAALPFLTAPERQAAVYEWNDTREARPVRPEDGAGLHELVEAQAARTPGNTALVWEEGSLTYAELLERSRGLARHLRKLGVGPESVVGLFAERSPELVVGILGVLQAGAAYLPLDPAYPRERLAYMLEDSGARLLLTQKRLRDEIPGRPGEVLFLEDVEPGEGPWHPPGVSPDQLAYVIYTSGSTGRPKGVAVPHRGVVNRLLEAHARFGITAADSILQRASIGFDASVWEFLSPLVAGGRVVLAKPGGHQDLAYMVRTLADRKVSIVHFVPSILEVLVAEPGLERCAGSLRLMIAGGEALSGALRDRFATLLPETLLANVYGPTEASIDLLWHFCTPEERGTPAATVPIGRPISNATAYVLGALDGGLRPVAVGVPGELYLGGVALVRGYLNRPDLTAERFVPHPSGNPGERLYRTGDLARFLPDGELEFLGRVDQQVKIRGVRIELGEIEAVLSRHPGIREAAVTVHDDPSLGRRLVAHAVPAVEGDGDPRELRRFLAAELPDAMVPAAYVFHEALPRTGSGKLDRRALAALAPVEERQPGVFTAPRTPTEEQLAAVFRDLLGAERIGIDDDFFELGGHSLLATRVLSRISRLLGVDLPVSALFQAPTVAALAERVIAAGRTPPAPPILPAPRDRALPLSFAQRRLWFLDRLEPGTATYNLPGDVRLAGPLDVPALAAALAAVERRHEALRTVFRAEETGPVQEIRPAAPAALPVVDLAGLPAAAREPEAARLADAEAVRPFDLAAGPLWRSTLLRLGGEEHWLLLTLHHIVADGWSLGLFLRELAAVYGVRGAALPALPIQYADYAVWQHGFLRGEVLDRQLRYWRRRLTGVPVLELPADRPRPAVRTGRGATRSLRLPETVPAAVERLARETGATPFMVLLAAFDALLGRITAEETVAVGTPVANRQQVEVEPLIGFFVNSLVLQARVGDDPRFADLLARVREDALGAFANQDLPFERLVEELRPERGMSFNPLFQVMFVLEEPLAALEMGDLRLEPRRVETGTAKFDLTLTVATGAEWTATAELDTDLFDAERIERLLGHWGNLLEGALAAPSTRLSDLPLLSEAEREQLLVAWNSPERFPVSEAETLHGRFARQAAGHADSIALVSGSDRLTYAELDAASNRLARHLQSLGVRPGELVGLCLERSADMVVGILAILKAGGAYVPLDPGYPRERHAFVLEDARIHVLVTRDDLLAALPDQHGARVVCLDGEMDAVAALSGGPVESAAGASGASDIAYVIYTSGSTGRPKGVAVSHGSVLRLFTATDALFGFGDGDVWTLFHSYAFDFSVWEIWGALLYGGRLVVVPFWVSRSPEAFYGLLADEKVTVLNQTPSAFRQLVALEGTEGAAGREAELALRWVVFGGEALEPAGLAAWLERHPERPRLVNMYGITETTVHVTFREITVADATGPGAGRSPIGRPIADLELYVLDRARNPVPAGVPGELYVGGPGLADGYLDRPELTADRFVPNPWAALRGEPGARLYRSGDLARFLPDGDVEYLGRIDHQVKVRGFRIELGEIEAALARHPEVLESAVVARAESGAAGGNRGSRLVGFAVPRQPGVLTPDELRSWIGASLPDYMVPSSLVLLEALPLTPSGKVDRRALALLEPAATIERAAYEAPRNPAEERLVEIWAEVLGLDRVGIQDDFFALGGHSLLATQLMARVRSVFAAEPPLRDLFEAPTPAAFAERLAGHVELEGIGSRVPLVPLPPGRAEAGVPLSFAQQRLWFLHELEPESAAYHIPGTLALTGPLRPAALAWSLGEIVRRHAALRTVFAAPGGAPVQTVLPAVALELPQADLAALPEEARRAEAARLERELSEKPFDLAAGPLMRTLLLRLGAEEHRLAVVMHHIVSDGWSLGVMVRELGVLYESALRGEPAGLPELRIQYPDFSVWQRRWLDGPVLDELLAYWRGRLSGELPLLDLPADRPRPAVRSGKGGLRPVFFSEPRTAGLRAVARSGGATLFMTLLAAFQTLIHRYTGQRDVLVGSPVANREALETEALIGCFINTLVLRGRPAPDRPFAALLADLREETLGAYDHQSLPFERLVEKLAPGRDRSRNPLFEVLLVLQNAPMPPLQLRDLRLALEEIDGGTTKLDLTLRLEERGAALAGMLEYDADLFEAATADRLLGHLDTLLAGIAENSGRPLEALPLLTVEERLELAAWNDTASAASAAAGACLHELVAARVQRSPDSEAVVADVDGRTVRWTAAELNSYANRLAHRLRALGIRPEERVGVCLRRTPSLIAALLGVLKAGGVYVPLDPAYPQERLAFMLADSGARVVLTEEVLSGRLSFFTGRAIRLDADAAEIAQFRDSDPALLPGGHATPDNLAYLIYTSGSTGRPKGVAIEHRSAAVMVRWAAEVFPPEDLAGALASTSVCFDLSVFEIFVPLAAGGRVILADNALALPALSVASEVTLINTVPSAIAELVRSGGLPPSVRTVNLAGEPLKAALVEQIYAGSRAERVLNLYGPSEDTTYSTYALVPRGMAAVSIGVPLAGSRVHLFGSSWAEPAPIGVPGELCLAGQGLARGYLGRPDLTAERFVPDPFGQAGDRLYRTGDLARWRDDGQLDFLGRLDHQVKVRGFRIELGEIEEVLAHHPAVKEVVVVAREDLSVGKSLVAYVVPRESWVLEAWGLGACDLGEGEGAASAPTANGNGHHEPDLAITLRGFLKTRLPEYMVPSFFVELPELPLTPNGKVDRKALPLPGTAGGGAGKVAPRTPVEELVAGLWAQVLGLPEEAEIGVFDSFFDLGGHSLLATQLVSRLREAFEVEMPLARLFETPTVAGLARRIEEARAAAAGTAPPMRRVPHALGQALPLSFAQERLWFLDHMQPGAAYNLPLGIRLIGAVDPARLSAVFEEIVRRHEALRTTFPEHDGDPVQVVGPPFAWELPLVDLTGVARADDRALALAREEALRPFDITRGPLLRTTLIRLAAEDHLLAFNMHHIVSDGWSLGVLLDEVAALYGASLAGEPSPLPELPVQYADFARWQREWLRGEELERQMGFWRRQLAGASALLELPTDRPRPQVQTSHGAWQPVSLPAELVRALGFGRRQGVTLFMVLLAAWQTLLFRYTGQRDLSVGSPIAGRNRGETERLIGFFVNTLVMRGDLSGNPSFEELLARVRRVALAAYAHQDLPFEKLVEELKPVRDMSHQPLFQVMLTLQNAPLGKMALPGLSLTPVEVGSSGSKFDLTLVLTEETDGVHGQLEYNTDLFDAATAARIAGQFRVLLEGIAESPRQTVASLPLLTPPERHQLWTEWSEARPGRLDLCVHQLLEHQAAVRPEATACIHEQDSWTFGELNRRANRLAGYLRGRGVGLESRVGLYVERDLDMLAGMFGVLKAGAAYLPFDSAFLGERLAFALADAEVRVLLTQERMLAKLAALDLPGVEVVCLDAGWAEIEAGGADENPGWPVDDLNAAYVIYTSGSTGTPKGVTVNHRGVVAYVEASADIFQVTPEDHNLQFSSISFDASVEEIYTCLARGATLVVRGEAQEGVSEFLRRIEDYGITVMQVPTAYFHQMAAAMETEDLPFPPKLRRLIAGGERILPQRLVSWWKRAPERLRFVNGYGPTETTVAVTMCCFPGPVPIDERMNEVPLGYPLRYVHAYVVDRWMQPVPIGVAGELLIGGISLARGYLRRPDLTAERFIPNPFGPVGGEAGDRLYRTGDLVRFLPNGMLEFLGRLDDQVKVRGFRIELGEIEAVLSRHAGVREAVVLARDDGAGEKRLVAYVSTKGEPAPTVAELREFLERHLPAYMVPSALLVLPALPVNVHGKVDRKALPDPRLVQAPQRTEYVAPAGELEEKIAEAWRELFGLDQVGVHDNFFDSGGNSLLIVKLHSRLQKVLGREFPLVEIFQHPTISALAASLGAGAGGPGGEPAKPSVAVQARARTDTRRESMRQLQERRGQRRNQRNER